MKKLTTLMALLAIFSLWSCSSNEADSNVDLVVENNDKDLGLIEADVKNNDEDLLGDMPTYSSDAPGTSQKIERSFENAPPMVPHSVDGLIPITAKSNMCISCHMPEVAVAMKATPIPVSHLTNYRPEVKLTKGDINIAASKKVTEKDLGGKLHNAMYNCTQCHVPQAKIDVVIQNNFTKVFRENDLKEKSNLNSTIKEGVK